MKAKLNPEIKISGSQLFSCSRFNYFGVTTVSRSGDKVFSCSDALSSSIGFLIDKLRVFGLLLDI